MSGSERGEEPYSIIAPDDRLDDRTRALQQGETFAVVDRHGDIVPVGLAEQGIYHRGTRHLSQLELVLSCHRPLLLSASLLDEEACLSTDLTNPDIGEPKAASHITRGTLHLHRCQLLWEGALHERLTIRNFGLEPVDLPLTWFFGADFADVFEVRGMRRAQRGQALPPRVEAAVVVLGYRGLDNVVRETRIELDPEPETLTGEAAAYVLHLESHGQAVLCLSARASSSAGGGSVATYAEARSRIQAVRTRQQDEDCTITTSNEELNSWLSRSQADLRMLLGTTPQGPYPYAGIPWFCTPFGRDGLVTALEWLWLRPDVARTTLAYLAATQATSVDPERDAEPGKILHEARKGEMAALGEVPFAQYYGSVDATPLFVVLAGAYHECTGDDETLREIWPNVRAALEWTESYGDVDQDGFVEYERHAEKGLANQGWKDSFDSVFHADGELVMGSIALCEVQAYVHEGRVRAAAIARRFGEDDYAEHLEQKASEMQRRFRRSFWCEESGTLAIALDPEKRPCRVRSSNAGHCLGNGLLDEADARRVADALMADESFSGFGIRTLDRRERRFNPMAYHNGSIWPHDNALIARALARDGFQREVLRIFSGFFAAARATDLQRLPELFCGFPKREGQGPVAYPVACSPQAWAAGAVFMLLQSCLGLVVDGRQGVVHMSRPLLPGFVSWIRIRGLRVGAHSIDMDLHRQPDDVSVNVVRREGPVEVVISK